MPRAPRTVGMSTESTSGALVFLAVRLASHDCEMGSVMSDHSSSSVESHSYGVERSSTAQPTPVVQSVRGSRSPKFHGDQAYSERSTSTSIHPATKTKKRVTRTDCIVAST